MIRTLPTPRQTAEKPRWNGAKRGLGRLLTAIILSGFPGPATAEIIALGERHSELDGYKSVGQPSSFNVSVEPDFYGVFNETLSFDGAQFSQFSSLGFDPDEGFLSEIVVRGSGEAISPNLASGTMFFRLGFTNSVPLAYTVQGNATANRILNGSYYGGASQANSSVSVSLWGRHEGRYDYQEHLNASLPHPNNFEYTYGEVYTDTQSIASNGILEPGDSSLSIRADMASFGPHPDVFPDGAPLAAAQFDFDFTLTLTPIFQEIHWVNPADGFFSDEENWDPAIVPESEHTAIFDLPGAYTITLDENVANQDLIVTGDGVDATLELNGFSYTLNNAGNSLAVGAGPPGSTSSLTVNNGTLVTNGSIVLGSAPGAAGSLTVLGTAAGDVGAAAILNSFAVSSSHADAGHVIADGVVLVAADEAVGRAVVSGGDALLDTIDIQVGLKKGGTVADPAALLRVEKQGSVKTLLLEVGVEAGSHGLITVDDGTLSAGSIQLGLSGHGRLEVLNGASSVVATELQMGLEPTSTAKLLVSGTHQTENENGEPVTARSALDTRGMYVGVNGPAEVHITDGGRIGVTDLGISIGSSPFGGGSHGDGLVRIVGGTLEATQVALVIAQQGSGAVGRLEVLEGATATFAIGLIGQSTVPPNPRPSPQNASATILVRGGTLEFVDTTGDPINDLFSENGLYIGNEGDVRVEAGETGFTNLKTKTVLLGAPAPDGTTASLPASATVTGVGAIWSAETLYVGQGAAATLYVEHGGLFTNQEMLTAGQSNVFVSHGGRIETLGNASVGVPFVPDIPAAATLGIHGAGSTWTIAGKLDVGGGATGGQGTIQLDAGGKLIVDTVEVVAGGKIIGDGGVLQATTRIKSGGYIQPGLSPGTLTIEGDFQVEEEGVLEIELADLAEGLFDTLIVTGDATIDGTVLLKFTGGFAPQKDDVFEFLIAGGDVDFSNATFTIANLAPGFEYDVALADGSLRLVALNDGAAIPEPGAMILCAIALVGLGAPRRPLRA